MIQKVFVDESMGITQMKEWYRPFYNGRTSVNSAVFYTGLGTRSLVLQYVACTS